LDRLHEELFGEKIVRTTFRKHLESWLEAKETATMVFYRKSRGKFIEFLGPRADQPITENHQAGHCSFSKQAGSAGRSVRDEGPRSDKAD
jgi:hypothetical protein